MYRICFHCEHAGTQLAFTYKEEEKEEWSSPCSSWLLLHTLNFTPACEVVTEKHVIHSSHVYVRTINEQSYYYACLRYFFTQNCLLRHVNHTHARQELDNKELSVRTRSGGVLKYSDGEYLPLKNGFAVCIFPEAKWIVDIRDAQGVTYFFRI